jgi:hypothetical protein
MDEGFIFGSFVSIWDANKNETMNISIRMCKYPLIVYMDPMEWGIILWF